MEDRPTSHRRERNRNTGPVALRERAGILLITLLLLTLGACRGTLQLEPSDHEEVLTRVTLDAPNPAEPGSFAVRKLYYGSGEDKNRPEYRDSVTIVTESVDGSKLVSLGGQAQSRNDYWGFTPEEFPLNARVWYPEGDGPFPLVLIVHGNHNMRDFSDPGYEYLGELLASRGYIMASIDMNFINGGIRGENDGRGWMLLKHVEAFEGFNEEEGNPFFGKVDMDRIALMGHSRGGEAVGHAAAFNRLNHYPDDASVTFDFNYNIRSIVAIAPVDGQYLPTERLVPVDDVNYLVFHGSHDGDVTSFHGLRLYKRLELNEPDLFKSAIYVYRANHGQWNSVWGPNDNGTRSGRILDLRALMPGEDQREFAKVYVSAFLEATLRGDDRYLPIFRDHRTIGSWLPETMYITRFMDGSFVSLADFEEDIDVTTGSATGVSLRGDSLSTWREGRLRLRSSNRPETSSSQDNQALWLGWNNAVRGQDEPGPAARYSIGLPRGMAGDLGISAESTVELSLVATDATPGPRRPAETDENEQEEEEEGARPERPAMSDEEEDDEDDTIDLSVEVVDAAGQRAKVALSEYGPIRRPLETYILRRSDLESSRFQTLWEMVLQTYSIPIADFVEANGNLNPRNLSEVNLVFDIAPAGTVVVDDIGFARAGAEYLEARSGM